LNRIVSYVDILEVPDAAKWLRGEELILTTGYAIKDNSDIQENIIVELAEHNASGIVIKMNRFLNSIPSRMIEKANELDLPIIELPSHIPYIDVTHPLLREILLRNKEERWVNEKLREILVSDFNSVHEIRRKLKLLNENFNTHAPVAIIIKAFDYSTLPGEYENIKNSTLRDRIISGEVDGNYIFICTINTPQRWKSELEELLFKTNMINSVDNGPVCISRLIKNLAEIKNEYERLKEAIGIIHRLNSKKTKYYYDDIIHYVFLNSISNMERTKEFVELVMEPFQHVDEKEREILIQTLHAYVKNNGNITKASKSLFIHRNTFIYRMKKIIDIIKSPLDTHNELFKYNIALSLYETMKQNDKVNF